MNLLRGSYRSTFTSALRVGILQNIGRNFQALASIKGILEARNENTISV